ncbi:Transposase InsO and inactivated derivatives [Carnobacterium alterfunditum]|uniref:Transposase InsO and inactivated derivatives n=1 Tax=Carnobacterium alterfunditum TaxID=28230 RepID=A0A1N6G9T6_9LACT|nr:IS3 family transposase [Carnobacterium alterfunditum]SIO04258.1 Transposase InsO and inactivated derivatives [Carnobacterium alterfunditum]
MSKKLYTEYEIEILQKNPNVKSASSKSITYSPVFKIKVVKESKSGMTSTAIFENAGLPEDLLGKGKAHQCVRRWKNSMAIRGQEGFHTETRGKGTRSEGEKMGSIEEQLEEAKARIAYLEGNLDLVKKLEFQGRSVKNEKGNVLKTRERYELINSIIREYSLKGMVKSLCEIAEVSRSGYYYWKNNEATRYKRYEQDSNDFELLYQVYIEKNKCGVEEIKMALEAEYDIVMNHKKIRRILRIYGIMSPIRKAKPYKKMMKATQEHKTKKNLVNRDFDRGTPYKVLLTDITYLPYGKSQMAYLSAVKDGATGEIVAHHFATSLKMNLVYQTLNKLECITSDMPDTERYLHSDQGFHYTNPTYQSNVEKMGFIQSMSRRGNCWDNAPMESFFGHMKDVVLSERHESLQGLWNSVEEYISFYNHSRYQKKLKKMTPVAYRDHLLWTA